MRTKLAAIVVLACFAPASDSAPTDESVAVETLLTDLTNPSGVAIRPGGAADKYEIFVADSGAGRIVHVQSHRPKSASEVVTGFSQALFGGEPMKAGPIGLCFLDRNRLVVGASGTGQRARLRLYELADGTAGLSADKPEQEVDLTSDGNPPIEPADHIYALARTRANDHVPDALVFTATRNERTAALHRVAVRAEQLGNVDSFAAWKTSSVDGFPVAVCVAPHGNIVVGDVGTLDKPRDSRIVFLNPVDGSPTMELPTDLHDIVALAYSPRTGGLYAADVAWVSPNDGGIYRIDDASRPGKPACIAVRIAKLAGPSAIAFGPDGALYVTAFGEPADAGTNSGTLLRLTGEP